MNRYGIILGEFLKICVPILWMIIVLVTSNIIMQKLTDIYIEIISYTTIISSTYLGYCIPNDEETCKIWASYTGWFISHWHIGKRCNCLTENGREMSLILNQRGDIK